MKLDIVKPDRFLYSVEGNHIQISPLALAVIDEFLLARKAAIARPLRYLEFGSGASTAYFVSNYPEMEVYSVEGDAQWYEKVKTWTRPKEYQLYPATNYYVTVNTCNMDYITCMEKYGPFDLILNDGAQREMVADYIFANPTKFIADGGMYLRHDYEKLLKNEWVGFHLPNMSQTTEQFVSANPGYKLITINGNGHWSLLAELGGVWKI